ncbi:MAG: hypothetical protein IT518_28980 [Burkholderiales bacterium]|nr:hypothetical protein [Burkholderiales bacterium]
MANAIYTPRPADLAAIEPTGTPIIRTTRGAIPGGAKGAARYVGLGVTAFYDAISRGVLPRATKIGRRSVWQFDHLDAAIARLAIDGDSR